MPPGPLPLARAAGASVPSTDPRTGRAETPAGTVPLLPARLGGSSADNLRSVGAHLGEFFPSVALDMDKIRQRNGYWHELVMSPGAVKVERRKMPGGSELETIRRPLLRCEDRHHEHTHSAECLLGGAHETVEVETSYVVRAAIREWSARSRARMLWRIASIDWDSVPGIAEMVTLTYPSRYPRDGRVVKAHFAAWKKRWERRWGAPIQGAWKQEFQRRGAPHLHVLCYRPAGSDFREFARWVSRSWYEVVGSGDSRHLLAGTGVDRETFRRAGKKASARRIAYYFTKHAALGAESVKAYQNEVPHGYRNPGRFWGTLGVEPMEYRVTVEERISHEIRRMVDGYRRSVNPWVKRSGHHRAWSLVEVPETFTAQLGRWVRQSQAVDHVTGEVLRVDHPPGRPRPLP